MTEKIYKIYGVAGHRQKESFNSSRSYDFSDNFNVRKLVILNSDRTGTNEYTILKITANSVTDCEEELNGQLSDGIFENCRTGRIEEVDIQ